MLNVKTFVGRPDTLDAKVNDFLKITNARIIDIKVSAMMHGENPATTALVTATIIYEREKYEGES